MCPRYFYPYSSYKQVVVTILFTAGIANSSTYVLDNAYPPTDLEGLIYVRPRHTNGRMLIASFKGTHQIYGRSGTEGRYTPVIYPRNPFKCINFGRCLRCANTNCYKYTKPIRTYVNISGWPFFIIIIIIQAKLH